MKRLVSIIIVALAVGMAMHAEKVSQTASKPLTGEQGKKPAAPYLEADTSRSRVVILTDIANEPDDKMSMVRLLLYANELDIEGLVATTSCWMRANPQPGQIEEVVDAYAEVRDNLLLHSPGYPSADTLRNLIKTGNTGFGMADVGEGNSSEGSDHLISVIDRSDSRPVWICVWGGANTLAQALWDARKTKTPAELERFVAKIRVYDIGGQDDGGAWLTHEFPSLYYLRSVQQWHGISYRIDGIWTESRGGDETVVTPQWFAKNIQNDHGALGDLYPDAAYLHEGDSPTFLYLVPTGLSTPVEPSWGSWGGRFKAKAQKNPWSSQPPVTTERTYKDFWMIREDMDLWQWNDQIYQNQYCAIFRWRADFQNDFAARMDWCTQAYQKANHNPVIVLNDDSGKAVIVRHVKPGEKISLNATKTHDPDRDSLVFKWWIYKEPGTYKHDIALVPADSRNMEFSVPDDAGGKTIHVVLTVRDDGSPQLTAYRRLVLHVDP